MAIYVIMNKIEDDKKKVVYEFGSNEKTMGIIEFNKIEKSFRDKTTQFITPINLLKEDGGMDAVRFLLLRILIEHS